MSHSYDLGGATDGDSNRSQKRYSHLEFMVVDQTTKPLGSIIGFNLQDPKGVSIPYNDALVIRATVTNYEL